MKNTFLKKIALLCMVATLTIGQCVSAMAASVNYSFSAKETASSTTGGTYNTYIIGTMSGNVDGTNRIIKLSVYGLYTLRGSQTYIDSRYGISIKDTAASSVTATAVIGRTTGDGRNYHTARCFGYYKMTKSSSWISLTGRDIAV